MHLFRICLIKLNQEISILIADNEYLVREGLHSIIDKESNLTVLGEANNESDLLEKTKRLDPNVVIIDYDQPGSFSVATVSKIKALSPNTGIMVVSSDDTKNNIYDVVEQGAESYITKQCGGKEVVDAIYATANKEKFFCHKILEFILDRSFGKVEERCAPMPLTPREVEIVQHIASGRIAKEIAGELHLSTHTIYTHRKNIMKKLNLSSPVELVMYAINKGLVDPKSSV